MVMGRMCVVFHLVICLLLLPQPNNLGFIMSLLSEKKIRKENENTTRINDAILPFNRS